ncbi:PucR family transcriptional regulator [Mycolicibacterium sp. P1-18]|uniref:PucR family transcriptional regulator n=1 Tax=Mycolicibacterium sp. P1-18 TaxID=2024615 RepID=UPI0011F3A45B|nr:helix-turn-helix domain-containing protein [Mycolicibacterium sp. P1-18]KAA0094103.1 PucR family transcriptional regulator [Mycolicibacterium sp. P1-18]
MITLDRLVNVLGSHGVRMGSCAIPRSTELGSVVLPEAVGDATVTGDVLLAIGARSSDEAVPWAIAARATVVLVRDDGSPALTPPTAGLAVLLVEPAVRWSELAAVVYGLVLEGRETESGRGPTDLFALADSLAESTGGAVTIEDAMARVLAYSRRQGGADPARVATIMDRQSPEHLHELLSARGVFAHLAASDAPLFVEPDTTHGLSGRMVVAVRSGRELMGSVWVSCRDALAEPELTALAHGARTVALHLLRSRASADLERQVESELVIRLLDGSADAAASASRLGLPPGPMRVIAVQASVDAQRDAALLLAFERATAGFGWSRPGRSALAGNTVYTLLPGEPAAAARSWVAGLRAALPDRTTLSAGISKSATASELPAARQEADECLALHGNWPIGAEPPAYDESWDAILLERLRAAARAGRTPDRGPIAELRRHDRKQGTEYASTLRAWLEALGDPAAAGLRLGVHENTVRYRMRKMAEVTDLPLHDARKRLAMMVELAAALAD